MTIKIKLFLLSVVVGQHLTIGADAAPVKQKPCPQIVEEYSAFEEKRSETFLRRLQSFIFPSYTLERKSDMPVLYEMVDDLTTKIDLTMPRTYIYEGNFLSRLPYWGHDPFQCNAFVDVSGALTIGSDLIKSCSAQELKAIIGHELGHIDKKHVLKRIAAVGVFLPATICAALAVFGVSSAAFGDNSLVTNIAAALLAQEIMFHNGFKACMMALSRTHEFEADLVSYRATGDSVSLVSALEKIHEIIKRKHPFLYYIGKIQYGLFPFLRSHPTTEQRALRLKRAAQEATVQ